MPRARQPRDHGIKRDVDDEIRFHLESRIRELVASGQSHEAARRIAKAEFGDVSASRRELVEVDSLRRARPLNGGRVATVFAALAQDLRQTARSLRRSPAFAIAAILTLAIGIGSSVTMFAVVNSVLLSPLPYGHPDRLVAAWHAMPSIGLARAEQSASTYFTYRQLARTIDGIGIYREGEVNIAVPGGGGDPERVSSATISATLLPVLEVAPLAGRIFTEADDRRNAPPVVLIDEAFWREKLGGDLKAVGTTLDVNGVSREIVGVMPGTFHFPAAGTRLWIPAQLDPLNPPGAGFEYGSVARLKSGVTAGDAERDFARVLPRAAELFPKFVPGISTAEILAQTNPRPSLVPLKEDLTGGIARTLWMIAAAAGLVLLVACANVANLTLVRADARQREIAVRVTLGAGQGRLMLHSFAESLIVAGIAAALGLGAAAIALRSLAHARPLGIPRLQDARIDATTVLFTIAVTAFVAIACGLIPALRANRGRRALVHGARGATASRMQHRLRGGLVAAQIALALVVLAGSGLLMRTSARLHAVHPGFNPEHVSTYWISLPTVRYAGDPPVVAFFSELADRVAGLPGVEVVGLTSRLPLETHGVDPNPLYPENDPSFATSLPPLELFTAANGDYFRAMGIPILAGRTFERMGSEHDGVAIVSRSAAEFFWKDPTGGAAVGKRFRPLPTDRAYTVIGVVGDTHDTTLAEAPSRAVYFPETIETPGATVQTQTKRTMALVVRTGGDASLDAAIRQKVRELDPSLPLFDIRPMSAVFSAATAQLTFILFILGGAAAVTLILGAVGLYGVLAYIVTLRRREMGIRLALGASPRALAAAMARYGIALTGAGIAFGLAIFGLVARFFGALLFGVAPNDPLTLAGSALILLAIAAAASWAPARRASRVDPAAALRAE